MFDWLEAHLLPCLVKTVFGVECPLCGLQRSVLLLFHGEVVRALRMWPALLPLLIFLGLCLLHFSGVKKIGAGVLKSVGFICLIIILISYLLKFTVVNWE